MKNFFALTVLGSVYLLGVSGLRFLSYSICSTGGCPDDGPWGGGWENQTVAVFVVLATIAMVLAARIAARARGRRSIDGDVRTTAWFAGFTVVLFAVPFFI